MVDVTRITDAFVRYLEHECRTTPAAATAIQLHQALSGAIINEIHDNWEASAHRHHQVRHAAYFSAEFLVGRLVYNNLLCLGITKEIEQMLAEKGACLASLEEIEDAALGNGGLGRLAACFLDSAATLNLPLDGYGIRYKYGLFRQQLADGFQTESADDWAKHGDPWSVRREEDTVVVRFADQSVYAVPYEMPVLGYGTHHVGTLCLWQAEPLRDFDFLLFNEQDYDRSVAEKNRAEDISRVLYPNDSTPAGKQLRLKQQYFFCSASLQRMLHRCKQRHGGDLSRFAEDNIIQLNDTHPVVAIPELIRLLIEEGFSFAQAWQTAQAAFAYTNHTVMAEALEKWDIELMESVLPDILKIITQIDSLLEQELVAREVAPEQAQRMRILQGEQVYMAYLAVYASCSVNGVARLHTEILKTDLLKDWYALYPARFQNKTNGITQRRWLALCNPELSALLTELLGDSGWITELSRLKTLERFADDPAILRRFCEIKRKKHLDLAAYVKAHDGIALNPDTIFDVQIKRLHEYKRQFLNILAILALYFEIKDGTLTDFTPTTFLFGAKAAPGYARAKAIIKLINQVAALIDQDEAVRGILKVVFVANYNVSYAEQLVAAADVSQQISTAGTEASGTGNMKLMLNGAVTLGTYDGANVEIVEEAGRENNYIFGSTVEELAELADSYDPNTLYHADAQLRRVLEALVDGTLDDGGTGMFQELYDSLRKCASWHKPDQYYLLLDFRRYLDAKKTLARDYQDSLAFARKCWMNICNSGTFSSDRTISQYAQDIWKISPLSFTDGV